MANGSASTSSVSLYLSAISAAEAGEAILGHAIFWLPEVTYFVVVKAFLWFEGEISGLPHTVAVDTTPCKKAPYGNCVVSPTRSEGHWHGGCT
jgi:hypothetical protein